MNNRSTVVCRWLLVALMLVPWASHADDQLTVGLSNELIAVGYSLGFRPEVSADFGLIHANQDDRRTNLLDVGLMVQQSNPTLQPRIGVQVMALDGSHVNAYGLAVAAGLAVQVVPRFWFDISGRYAPDIVMSGDFDRLYEIDSRVAYDLLDRAQLFAGFKSLEAARQGPNYRIYQGVEVGFSMRF